MLRAHPCSEKHALLWSTHLTLLKCLSKRVYFRPTRTNLSSVATFLPTRTQTSPPLPKSTPSPTRSTLPRPFQLPVRSRPLLRRQIQIKLQSWQRLKLWVKSTCSWSAPLLVAWSVSPFLFVCQPRLTASTWIICAQLCYLLIARSFSLRWGNPKLLPRWLFMTFLIWLRFKIFKLMNFCFRLASRSALFCGFPKGNHLLSTLADSQPLKLLSQFSPSQTVS